MGTNDVRYKQSIKLHHDMELLAVTVTESLGKLYVISGPIPTLRKGCEGFSRLFSFISFSFLDHFDVFFNRRDLYNYIKEIIYTLTAHSKISFFYKQYLAMLTIQFNPSSTVI